MPKKSSLLAFGVFSVLTLVFAAADFAFMNNISLYTIIWRYPSSKSTLLGAIWFGEVCAALLAPLVLRCGFRIRRFFVPWTILAAIVAIHQTLAAYNLVNSPFNPVEIVWRTLHMPMASLQTMTFSTDTDYFVRFITLQIILGAILAIGHVVGYIFFRNRGKE